MKCETIQDDLSAYLDGELPADARATVESHLKDCAECKTMLEELKSVVSFVAEAPSYKAPATLVEKVHARVAASPAPLIILNGAGTQSSGGYQPRSMWGPIALGVAALFMLFVLAFAIMPALDRGSSVAKRDNKQPFAAESNGRPEVAMPENSAAAPAMDALPKDASKGLALKKEDLKKVDVAAADGKLNEVQANKAAAAETRDGGDLKEKKRSEAASTEAPMLQRGGGAGPGAPAKGAENTALADRGKGAGEGGAATLEAKQKQGATNGAPAPQAPSALAAEPTRMLRKAAESDATALREQQRAPGENANAAPAAPTAAAQPSVVPDPKEFTRTGGSRTRSAKKDALDGVEAPPTRGVEPNMERSRRRAADEDPAAEIEQPRARRGQADAAIGAAGNQPAAAAPGGKAKAADKNQFGATADGAPRVEDRKQDGAPGANRELPRGVDAQPQFKEMTDTKGQAAKTEKSAAAAAVGTDKALESAAVPPSPAKKAAPVTPFAGVADEMAEKKDAAKESGARAADLQRTTPPKPITLPPDAQPRPNALPESAKATAQVYVLQGNDRAAAVQQLKKLVTDVGGEWGKESMQNGETHVALKIPAAQREAFLAGVLKFNGPIALNAAEANTTPRVGTLQESPSTEKDSLLFQLVLTEAK